ncbi:hypothetical protein [cf. Phormidesmis sp. LEGE 11477]|uniref:hypothetical protein n=1 Tax=cf. Phormidesmis sp. LEGE 11477 TaxID=1828680 RepID=UPI001880ED7A|nr:hypothetical protein [cf. Phormidesmis sp. LEGE 11477]MBE9063030.1 hypothetical protein [cf. Phormidesmis sp. LEGE 11477]
MVDVTTAVKSASKYLKQVEQVMGSELENLRLEEVEKEEGTDHWLITLGYDARSALPPASSLFNDPEDVNWKYERAYKLFRINAETGEVESMKIRKV